jgi:hypothetical protein
MTPLDEGSARRRDLYLTTHNTHNRRTSMSVAYPGLFFGGNLLNPPVQQIQLRTEGRENGDLGAVAA